MSKPTSASLARLRRAHADGMLTRDQIEAVEKIDGWEWDGSEGRRKKLQEIVDHEGKPLEVVRVEKGNCKAHTNGGYLVQGCEVEAMKVRCVKCGWWWWVEEGDAVGSCPICALGMKAAYEDRIRSRFFRQSEIYPFRILALDHSSGAGNMLCAWMKCENCGVQEKRGELIEDGRFPCYWRVVHSCKELPSRYGYTRIIDGANGNVYFSYAEAADEIGCSRFEIVNCLDEKTYTAAGHHLWYEDDEYCPHAHRKERRYPCENAFSPH